MGCSGGTSQFSFHLSSPTSQQGWSVLSTSWHFPLSRALRMQSLSYLCYLNKMGRYNHPVLVLGLHTRVLYGAHTHTESAGIQHIAEIIFAWFLNTVKKKVLLHLWEFSLQLLKKEKNQHFWTGFMFLSMFTGQPGNLASQNNIKTKYCKSGNKQIN